MKDNSTLIWKEKKHLPIPWKSCLSARSIASTNVESVTQALKINELHQWAEWVWLAAQFVWPTAALWECCHRAAVGTCCPYPSPLRLTSCLLLRTTAGSWTEHSVVVARDIRGNSFPTPIWKVTSRLMRVTMSAGYMLCHHKCGVVLDKGYGGLTEVFGDLSLSLAQFCFVSSVQIIHWRIMTCIDLM